MANILIVDDEQNIRGGLKKALENSTNTVFTAEDGKEGWSIFLKEQIDIAILDIAMPKMTGFELMEKMMKVQNNFPVIFITGHGSIESAVKAMHLGAYDFLTKPINLEKLELIISRALHLNEVQQTNITLSKQVKNFEIDRLIISESKAMSDLKQRISQVAQTKGNVYIYGESGTGKELVCDAIHKIYDEKSPLIKVNCAALSPTLLESELFGHEKGSFTGATEKKIGRFEMAEKGILFLDEVSEIPPFIQVKLLRVLQEKEIERVGMGTPISVDFRLICASNKDLALEVKKERFREDLFYRINVLDIVVPPLRERRNDIYLLAKHFFNKYFTENKKKEVEITPQVFSALSQYDWPGNVRQLSNIIEKTVVFAGNKKKITIADLPEEIKIISENKDKIEIPFGASMEEAKKIITEATLKHCKGNKKEAAELLKIGRKTLYRNLQSQ